MQKYNSRIGPKTRALMETFMQDYEIHGTPHHNAPAYSTGGEDLRGNEPGDEVSESGHPFAISIRNDLLDTTGSASADENASYIRSATLRITVNGGTATVFGQSVSFSQKNFNIPFTEDGMTKVYAEVDLHKQNFTFSRIGNATLNVVKSGEPDANGVGHVTKQTDTKETRYQMIGTIMVVRKARSFEVKVNQLLGGSFAFGTDVGTDSDVNGISTRPGSKEFIATINDKLYTVTVEVTQMKAVEAGE